MHAKFCCDCTHTRSRYVWVVSLCHKYGMAFNGECKDDAVTTAIVDITIGHGSFSLFFLLRISFLILFCSFITQNLMRMHSVSYEEMV